MTHGAVRLLMAGVGLGGMKVGCHCTHFFAYIFRERYRYLFYLPRKQDRTEGQVSFLCAKLFGVNVVSFALDMFSFRCASSLSLLLDIQKISAHHTDSSRYHP